LIDRLIARPISLIAGHLGYGTDITIYAVKQHGMHTSLLHSKNYPSVESNQTP
jgi:hypothetical protein